MANSLKIAHISDIHYSTKNLKEVDKCFSHAIDVAIEQDCGCAVLSGDIFDHRIDLHAPAVTAVINRVIILADSMPALILQGTFSHDAPGSLDVFKTINSRYPVHVADKIEQVTLIGSSVQNHYSWVTNVPHENIQTIETTKSDENQGEHKVIAVFSCLPPINKAEFAAKNNAIDASSDTGKEITNILESWSKQHESYREQQIPTILVSHGTVTGCTTEQGVVMHGTDHEFTTEMLFAAESSAVLLGHIHQFQTWLKDNRVIAYPGSPGRLHFGEVTDKGFLIWDVDHEKSSCAFHKTPAKYLLQIEYPGAPDMDELTVIAKEQAEGAHVRIRYQINEEYRATVDKPLIRSLFMDQGAEECKVEGRINPIQRTRSEGITQLPSIIDQLGVWAKITETDPEPLKVRLEQILSADIENVLDNVYKQVSA